SGCVPNCSYARRACSSTVHTAGGNNPFCASFSLSSSAKATPLFQSGVATTSTPLNVVSNPPLEVTVNFLIPSLPLFIYAISIL
ncbi:hypothetical protein, partial [Bacillus pseudomycoides]|uniref:hypothetical protein n=1 Tax=Bacillus pseudomycoides TaxID=64104 RepID=UPI0028525911